MNSSEPNGARASQRTGGDLVLSHLRLDNWRNFVRVDVSDLLVVPRGHATARFSGARSWSRLPAWAVTVRLAMVSVGGRPGRSDVS
jgi:hypothetical protein